MGRKKESSRNCSEKSQQGKENYLRVIYELLSEKQGKEEQEAQVKSIDIAKKLEITKASVSEMIKKLSEQGLIIAKPYSSIKLTGKGRKIAREVAKKHETIEKFIIKIGHEKPHEEAHELEHAFSLEAVEKLNNFIEGKISKIKGKQEKKQEAQEKAEEKKELPSYIG